MKNDVVDHELDADLNLLKSRLVCEGLGFKMRRKIHEKCTIQRLRLKRSLAFPSFRSVPLHLNEGVGLF